MGIAQQFRTLTEQYGAVYKEVAENKDWGNSFKNLISKTIPSEIRNSLQLSENYKVVGSYGKGLWTAVPWIAVFDTRITSSARSGVYVVYLLNRVTKELFLTLDLAATEKIKQPVRKDGKKAFTGVTGHVGTGITTTLAEQASEIRKIVKDDYFSSDQNCHSGAVAYDAGAIYYKKYAVSDLSSDEQLINDLRKMLHLYNQYYSLIYMTKNNSEEEVAAMDYNENSLERIERYIESKGFHFCEGLIRNFYLCLKTKPFVILAGTSGTGKTKLVKLFAEAVGARYWLAPVRPDWSDSSDLFGHVDLNGHFIEGSILGYIHEAQLNPEQIYILCLDEMNLARVEYYLSDFLSVIETRELNSVGQVISAIPLVDVSIYGCDKEAAQKFGQIRFPENLYVVGTVNMDETTFPFSKKVLDRANTIEFSDVNLVPDFTQMEGEPVPVEGLTNDFLKTKYLILKDCKDSAEYVIDICSKLDHINQILKTANAHVGYRVRDEIVFYMLNNKNDGSPLLKENEAFDNAVLQKILPRIQGSSAAVRDMLCSLFVEFGGDYTQKTGDSDSDKMRKVLLDPARKCRSPKCAEKIQMMVRRFEEDGFTSFWV